MPGNYDSNIVMFALAKVSLTSPAMSVPDDALLTHCHTRPSKNLAEVARIVMGHLYPVIRSEGSRLDGERM